MGEKRGNDCITCWNLSPIHTGFKQLHQGSFTLHAYKLVVCLPAKNSNNISILLGLCIYSMPLFLAVITSLNKMTGGEIHSFFPP